MRKWRRLPKNRNKGRLKKPATERPQCEEPNSGQKASKLKGSLWTFIPPADRCKSLKGNVGGGKASCLSPYGRGSQNLRKKEKPLKRKPVQKDGGKRKSPRTNSGKKLFEIRERIRGLNHSGDSRDKIENYRRKVKETSKGIVKKKCKTRGLRRE